jgi:hypothetical protein
MDRMGRMGNLSILLILSIPVNASFHNMTLSL